MSPVSPASSATQQLLTPNASDSAPGVTAALRRAVDSAPTSPGVYIFLGDRTDLPLYIGKSVNLRSRLQSHLRNPDETRMLAQTRRIEVIRTAGEIGALLLEASLIKQRQPLFNQRLRRNRQLCSVRLRAGRPEVVDARSVDFAAEPGLHGLFSSRHAALAALRDLADTHRLCWGALGLERVPAGRGCFRSMIGRCAGVCRGDETPTAHQTRLAAALEAMRVCCWPYQGAIGVVERSGDLAQIHVVRNWCYLGSCTSVAEAGALTRVASSFDADGYKILAGPIMAGTVETIPLP